MDNTLQAILINTYNCDANLRKEAENALLQFFNTPGFLSAFAYVIGNPAIHKDLRQSACIMLKNKLREIWREKEPTDLSYITSLEEKQVVREQLLSVLMVETDNSIRGLLAESIRAIAEFDYPKRY